MDDPDEMRERQASDVLLLHQTSLMRRVDAETSLFHLAATLIRFIPGAPVAGGDRLLESTPSPSLQVIRVD